MGRCLCKVLHKLGEHNWLFCGSHEAAQRSAIGKSTFIRSRLDELEDFKILMTDVYKARTKNLVVPPLANNFIVVTY